MTKTCTKCEQDLPLTEFGKNSSRKDGLMASCKSCVSHDNKARAGGKSAVQRQRYRTDPEYRAKVKAQTSAWHRRQRADPEAAERLRLQRLTQRNAERSTPEGRRKLQDAHRRRSYSMTPEDWDRLIEEQAGRCAVCLEAEDLYVDHDHSCCPGQTSCGKCIRGLLCHRCNLAEGYLRSDPALVRNLAEYLER